MPDPKEKLDATAVREAALDDFVQIFTRLRARFRTGDFATGLDFVNRIGVDAEALNHHPDVTLTYPEVLVTTSSHDVGGITSRDLELARRISAHARELGLTSDPAGVMQLELGLDTASGERLAPFYAALFGSDLVDGEPVDASGQMPTVWWQEPGDDAGGAVDADALPEQSIDQRWHFDVWVAREEAERRVQAMLDAGGRLVSDRNAPAYWVLEDADGNRHCLCTAVGR